jgi:sulfhydrogenase subunit delta
MTTGNGVQNAVSAQNAVAQRPRPRVAIHSLTGCAGCQLTVYFIKDRLLDFLGAVDIVAAPMIKGKNDPGPYDVCFVEGSVCSERDIEHLKEWRKASKILVALGTCATHANVQGIKNFMDAKAVQERVYGEHATNLSGHATPVAPSPIDAYVTVDYRISGCPPEEVEFLRFIKELLVGMKPRIYNEPVCVECTKRETDCLLEKGIECMGPLIRGGCNALCPAVKHGCTGCHGPIEEANIPQTMELLKACGVPLALINQHLQKYAGKDFERLGAAIRAATK